MNYSPKKLKSMNEKHDFSFKKKFGQNFIVDENIINKIVRESKIDKNSFVIEVGPGSGALTYKLAENAKNVLCYEIDEDLKKILDDNLRYFDNVDIIYNDFLKANVSNDISKYKFNSLYLIANLPYYITTPIIVKMIEEKIEVDDILIMVQKEVGDRFKAKPGSKNYGSLSVFLNYYFNVSKVMDVSRTVFLPTPNVDSIVVSLSPKKEKFDLEDEQLFFKLVKDSFKQKRKTIKNNLKEYDLEVVEKVLNKFDYDLSVRAEKLSIEIFVELSNELHKK